LSVIFPIYLPIAEMTVDGVWLLVMGWLVGVLSGMFGVGGGFLMTPLLIFYGIPPAIAVGTQSNQLVAASVSGVLAHLRRKTVDIRMGLVMLGGSTIGTILGIQLFRFLKALGQIDLVIQLSYVFFLGAIALLMLVESLRAWHQNYRGVQKISRKHKHYWIHHLPLKIRFPSSGLYISIFGPLLIGFIGGVLVAIMGVGGGFFLVPAMIYILGMPAGSVAGTSLFQIIFTTILATVLHAVQTQSVDVVMALILLLGSVIGAQFGAKWGLKLRGDYMRFVLALLVLSVAAKLAFDLLTPPENIYQIEVIEPHLTLPLPL